MNHLKLLRKGWINLAFYTVICVLYFETSTFATSEPKKTLQNLIACIEMHLFINLLIVVSLQ